MYWSSIFLPKSKCQNSQFDLFHFFNIYGKPYLLWTLWSPCWVLLTKSPRHYSDVLGFVINWARRDISDSSFERPGLIWYLIISFWPCSPWKYCHSAERVLKHHLLNLVWNDLSVNCSAFSWSLSLFPTFVWIAHEFFHFLLGTLHVIFSGSVSTPRISEVKVGIRTDF